MTKGGIKSLTKEEEIEFDKLTSKFKYEDVKQLADFIDRVAKRAWTNGQLTMVLN